jgi:hypothetical protein
MNSDTKHDRDPFTLSLGGIRVVNSHAMASAIAANGINRTWDARLGRSPKAAPRCDQSSGDGPDREPARALLRPRLLQRGLISPRPFVRAVGRLRRARSCPAGNLLRLRDKTGRIAPQNLTTLSYLAIATP